MRIINRLRRTKNCSAKKNPKETKKKPENKTEEKNLGAVFGILSADPLLRIKRGERDKKGK